MCTCTVVDNSHDSLSITRFSSVVSYTRYQLAYNINKGSSTLDKVVNNWVSEYFVWVLHVHGGSKYKILSTRFLPH